MRFSAVLSKLLLYQRRWMLLASLVLLGASLTVWLIPPAFALAPKNVPTPGLYLTDSIANPGKVFQLNPTGILSSFFDRPTGGGILTHFAFAPNGTLYFSDETPTIYTVDAQNSTQVFCTDPSNRIIRDLATDSNGNLYYSVGTGIDNGSIFTCAPATGAQLFYPVLVQQTNNYWRGDFAFDSNNTLYLSNGNSQPGAINNIYQVVSNVPTSIYTSTNEIAGFVRDATGAFYYTDVTTGIYRVTLGNAPTLVWAIPAPSQVPDLNIVGTPTAFQGNVFYEPSDVSTRLLAGRIATNAPRVVQGQSGVPLTLLGYTSPNGAPITLANGVSAPDGTFDLGTPFSGFDHFKLVKGLVRGTVPMSATVSVATGTILDATAVRIAGSASGALCCSVFHMGDPVVPPPKGTKGRYLIITTNAMLPFISDFVVFKKYQGFTVAIKTMESLGGTTRDQKTNNIRSFETSLLTDPLLGLRYVLFIGSDTTIPFVRLPVFAEDPFRNPPKYHDACGKLTVTQPNECGWPSDWPYVDLLSNWDSNGDGYIGEAIWPDPKNPPSIQDAPPAFHPDVFLGRLQNDNGYDVQKTLNTIMDFERDSGPWKDNTLLSGAMMDYGGQTWAPIDNIITGTYKVAGGPTDNAKLMERVWNTILQPQGYNRQTLYEKQHPPTGAVPSSYVATLPLSRTNLLTLWQSQDVGLVKVAGHGNSQGVYRLVWTNDYNSDGKVQSPTMPISTTGGYKSRDELDSANYLNTWDAYSAQSPNRKPAVLMVMGCSTGESTEPNNLPNTFLSIGDIAAWTGGTGVVAYASGWSSPASGWGQTIDYNVTDAIFRRHLPMGDAVWTGLNDYWTAMHNKDWGFINWDLYGDPSMNYWGEGPDLFSPWPMFHYDQSSTGFTGLEGPYTPTLAWSGAIASVPPSTLVSSPVIARDDSIIIGDASGVVRSYSISGAVNWSYATGGAIINAAAVASDGTVYVKSQDGYLYSIDNTGALRWKVFEGASEASPKIGGDGTIYVGGYTGSTYFLDSFQPNKTRNARIYLDGRVTTAPALSQNGNVYVGTANGTLYKLKFDLTLLISKTVAAGNAFGNGIALTASSTPNTIGATANGLVIDYSSFANVVRWTVNVTDAVQAAPAFANDTNTVYVGTHGGKVYALKESDGSQVWVFNANGPVDSAPAVDATAVYVIGGGSPAKLYAINRSDGTEKWEIAIGGTSSLGSSPAIGNSDMIYVAANDGRLHAIAPYIWFRPPTIAVAPKFGLIDININPGDPDPFSQIQLERRTLGGSWQLLGSLSQGQTQFQDTNITKGMSYQYRALTKFVNSTFPKPTNVITQPSNYSAPVAVRAPYEIPTTPPAPVVTPLSATELRITWSAVPANAASLAILRQGPSDNQLITITLTAANVFTYTDSNLTPVSLYTYALRAIGESGASPQSQTGSGTTFGQGLPAPHNLIVMSLNNTSFQICWTPGQAGLGSVIARETDGVSVPQEIGTSQGGQNCFTDYGSFAGGFVYLVKHISGQNESPWARSSRTQAPNFAPSVISDLFLPLITR